MGQGNGRHAQSPAALLELAPPPRTRFRHGMDDLEQRVAALETAFYEVMAWLDSAALEDASRSIKAGLAASISSEERDVRLGALHLVEDAQRRFGGLSGG